MFTSTGYFIDSSCVCSSEICHCLLSLLMKLISLINYANIDCAVCIKMFGKEKAKERKSCIPCFSFLLKKNLEFFFSFKCPQSYVK